MRRRTKFLLFVLIIFIGVVIVRAIAHGPTIPTGAYLVVDIGGTYVEAPPQDLLGRFFTRQDKTLIDLLTTIRKAQVDDRIKGVIARITPLQSGWAKVQDIRDAFTDFKQAGKPLLALLVQEVGGSNPEYYLASVADRIYLSPNTTAPLNGLAAHFTFLGGIWEKLDIDMTVEKIAEYKTFGDMIAFKEMTPAHREMANSLLDSVNEQFVGTIAQARGLEPDAVRAVIDQCPVTPAEFEATHLCDGAKHLQDLHDELGGKDAPLVEMKDYAHVSPESLHLNTGPKVAVVYGVGTIVTGESGSSVQGQMMGADTVSEALSDAADESDIRAIVFRIDSPGGSALASDLVWRATQAARAQKPVIVSMSDVAGSGGYYIAAGANRIVAQPATFTGSIGVVFARPNIKGLLIHLGINTETITRGKFAAIDDLTMGLTPQGRQKLVAEMTHVYDVFVERVAAGRGLSAEQVNAIGRGRVWTGMQAKANNLVDDLGGFRSAIQVAKQAAGIDAAQEVELVFYPRRKGVVERVAELLNTHAAIELPPALQHALRSVTLPFEDGSILALMAESIEVR